MGIGGIDFGTSNSSIGVIKNDKECMIKLSGHSISMPTALFYDGEKRNYSFGENAINEYSKGNRGRMLLSIKRALGSNLSTMIGNSKIALWELTGKIIEHIKLKAENQLGNSLESIVVGRPVKFHDTNQIKDQGAELELRKACQKAGFKNITFLAEPIGGIYGSLDQLNFVQKKEIIVLVCDIGGGTSDFSIAKVINRNGKVDVQILGNDGIYLGGDEITAQIMWHGVNKYIGKGSQYKSENKILTVPIAGYPELKYWNQIHNLQFGNDRRAIVSTAPWVIQDDKLKYNRLLEISNDINKGYQLRFLANKMKIELTHNLTTTLEANMFKDGFEMELTRGDFDGFIESTVNQIIDCMNRTIIQSGVSFQSIDQAVLIGGTSQIPQIHNKIENLIGKRKVVQGDTYNSVAKGLTKYANQIYK